MRERKGNRILLRIESKDRSWFVVIVYANENNIKERPPTRWRERDFEMRNIYTRLYTPSTVCARVQCECNILI